jgi:cell division protein FtsL
MKKPTGNIWPLFGAFFGFFSIVALSFIADLATHFGFAFDIWKFVITFLAISLLLGAIGLKIKQFPNRVLLTVLLLGAGFFPLLIWLSIPATGLALALSIHSRSIFLLILIVVTLAWCTYQLHEYRKRIVERHFMEKEFFIDERQISMRNPNEISLDAPPVTNKTLWGRSFNKVGPYLFLLIPFAYPLQKLVGNINGFLGVYVLLAVLSTPLAIYMLGRLTCGAYLYVYEVRRLERKYGKPVMFSSDNL